MDVIISRDGRSDVSKRHYQPETRPTLVQHAGLEMPKATSAVKQYQSLLLQALNADHSFGAKDSTQSTLYRTLAKTTSPTNQGPFILPSGPVHLRLKPHFPRCRYPVDRLDRLGVFEQI